MAGNKADFAESATTALLWKTTACGSRRPVCVTAAAINGLVFTPLAECEPVDFLERVHCWVLIGKWMAKCL